MPEHDYSLALGDKLSWLELFGLCGLSKLRKELGNLLAALAPPGPRKYLLRTGYEPLYIISQGVQESCGVSPLEKAAYNRCTACTFSCSAITTLL